MTSNKTPHLVNIDEVKKMTVEELFQRIADHEKHYIDQLKADALKREKERAKQSSLVEPNVSPSAANVPYGDRSRLKGQHLQPAAHPPRGNRRRVMPERSEDS